MAKSELARILPEGMLDRRKRKPKIDKPLKMERIDWDKANDLLVAGCPGTEVASFFGMAAVTFYDAVVRKYGMTFSDYRHSLKQKGESILRAHQFAKAIGLTKEGDNTLLIWLGKQRLGQSESPHDHNVSETAVKNFNELMSQLNGLHGKPVEIQLEED